MHFMIKQFFAGVFPYNISFTCFFYYPLEQSKIRSNPFTIKKKRRFFLFLRKKKKSCDFGEKEMVWSKSHVKKSKRDVMTLGILSVPKNRSSSDLLHLLNL